MAGEGYGTTSIGTGGAQVVGSPNYNIERYAQPLIQEQKQKAAKEADQIKRNDKILGDLKGLSKVGSLRYGAAMDKFRGEIIEKAKKAIQTQDINDLLDLENSKLQFNTIMDLAKQNDAFRNNVGQQMLQGGNFWNKEFFDEYHNPLDVSKITKPEDLIGQMTIDRDNLSEIRKDTHNPVKFRNDMEATAKEFLIRPEGFTEDDLKGTLAAMFTSDLGDDKPYNFDAYKHYEIRAKQDKALMDKFGGDAKAAAMDLAFNDYKYLLGKLPPKQKGGLTINVGGDKGDSFDKYSVTEQVFKEGFGVGGEQRDVKQLVAMYPTPVVHGTFKVPVGGTVNGEPSDGTVVVQDVKFNVTKQKAVMDEDITYTGSTGAKITVKKGQVINEVDIPLATKVLGRQPKYEYKYISEGFTPEGDIVNVDADIIAPASVAALKGATGKGALGTYQEKSNKELQDKGNKNVVSKSVYSYNGQDYTMDELITRYGSEDKAKKAISQFGFKLKK